MSLEQIFMILLGSACACLGWFCRVLYDATQSLRRDLSGLEVQLSRDYVRYDRLRDALQDALLPITESLQEIKHTLAKKADKP